MVMLKRASPTAQQFYTFVTSDAARAVFKKYGYGVPPA
jgi:ABC-type molybdate transport system substrate-binding protein